MNAADLVESVRRLQELPNAFDHAEITFGGPWHFNVSHAQGERVPHEYERGIYFYTSPGPHPWQVPLQDNQNDIWYVGKAGAKIGGRVWGHMSKVIDPATGMAWVPRFKQHRWATTHSIPQDIRDSVANGEVVVYTAAIAPHPHIGLLAEILEKHVLIEYTMRQGRLPPLNLQM